MINSILLSLGAAFIAAIAQILLKKTAARNVSEHFLLKFLNASIFIAYMMMLMSSLMNTIALRKLPLYLTPVTDVTGYIWVPLLSCIFLKEYPSRRTVLGICIIIIGIMIFAY